MQYVGELLGWVVNFLHTISYDELLIYHSQIDHWDYWLRFVVWFHHCNNWIIDHWRGDYMPIWIYRNHCNRFVSFHGRLYLDGIDLDYD